jgi:hypothetical protein
MISLMLKLALVCVSAGLYAIVAWHSHAEMPEPLNLLPLLWDDEYVLVGALFGLLVLGPYAAAPGRLLRIAGLTGIAALAYYLSIHFVLFGPFGDQSVLSYAVAGAGASVVCALAVVVFTKAKFAWVLIPIWLFAGALSGVAFEFYSTFDRMLVTAHAAWQVLLCIALHVSFRWVAPHAIASDHRT